MPEHNIKLANDFADEYDKTVLPNNWHGPEVLFNLCNPFLKPGYNLLDLGIGTGESSRRFKAFGLKITGLDASAKMLEMCRQKKLATKLVMHDLEKSTFPFRKRQFDVVLSNGVFHLIYPLEQVFTETARILKNAGYFVFSYENTQDVTSMVQINPGIWEYVTKGGVYTYKYSDDYIKELLDKYHFKIVEANRFLAFRIKKTQKVIYFNAILAVLK